MYCTHTTFCTLSSLWNLSIVIQWLINCYIQFNNIPFSLFNLFDFFIGADTEFLVRLRQPHWFNIHIGYCCTATDWLSGTRTYSKYSICLLLLQCTPIILFTWEFHRNNKKKKWKKLLWCAAMVMRINKCSSCTCNRCTCCWKLFRLYFKTTGSLRHPVHGLH